MPVRNVSAYLKVFPGAGEWDGLSFGSYYTTTIVNHPGQAPPVTTPKPPPSWADTSSPTPTPASTISNPPPWANTAPTAPANVSDFCPDCGGMDSGDGGSGASSGDPVNLANGQESYEPAADLMTYNPNGPKAAWQRSFSTDQALKGYATPGLARGWVSNADVFVTSLPGVWGTLTLHYPNGTYEYLTPQFNSSSTAAVSQRESLTSMQARLMW